MKKVIMQILTGLTICFVAFLSFSQGLEGVPAGIHTPQALVKWISTEFTYKLEMVDKWQPPQETINTKNGDCEDFAVLVSSILSQLGINSHILVLKFYNLETAHAICIWQEENGTYDFTSNMEFYRTKETNLEHVITKYYPDCQNIKLVDITGRCIQTIKQSKVK